MEQACGDLWHLLALHLRGGGPYLHKEEVYKREKDEVEKRLVVPGLGLGLVPRGMALQLEHVITGLRSFAQSTLKALERSFQSRESHKKE